MQYVEFLNKLFKQGINNATFKNEIAELSKENADKLCGMIDGAKPQRFGRGEKCWCVFLEKAQRKYYLCWNGKFLDYRRDKFLEV